jgi:hypothetical protein
MQKVINIRDAKIKTTTVEIKSMVVSNRQVTLALFRQLREERLIADDGTLRGVPWGTVNYCPHKCISTPHWHVVWQKGDELRRATVKCHPPFMNVSDDEEIDDDVVGERKERPFEHDVVDAYVTVLVRDTILGPVRRKIASTELPDLGENQLGHYHYFTRRGLRLRAYVEGKVRQLAEDWRAWKKSAERHHRLKDFRQYLYDKYYEEYEDEEYVTVLDKLEEYGDLHKIETELDQVIDAELNSREQWRLTLQQLAALPQLFIAV